MNLAELAKLFHNPSQVAIARETDGEHDVVTLTEAETILVAGALRAAAEAAGQLDEQGG